MQAGTIQDHLADLFDRVQKLEDDMADVKTWLAEMAAVLAEIAGSKPKTKGKGSD